MKISTAPNEQLIIIQLTIQYRQSQSSYCLFHENWMCADTHVSQNKGPVCNQLDG